MAFQAYDGCDRSYDEDFDLECPGCGEPAYDEPETPRAVRLVVPFVASVALWGGLAAFLWSAL